jgi:hypothetical protein
MYLLIKYFLSGMKLEKNLSVNSAERTCCVALIGIDVHRECELGADAANDVVEDEGTLGVELDRYIRRLTAASVSLGFIADAYASALADGACSAAVSELLGDTPHTAPFAIGYADTDLSLLPRLAETTDAGRLIGISFSSSNLIIPTKSIIVIVGKM